VNNYAVAACFVALGSLTSLVARSGASAYHDGVRPLLPEYRSGELGGQELSRQAWSLSAGWITWFALPFTLVTRVATSHLVFLLPEVLGLRRSSRTVAALAGGVWGFAVFLLVAGMRALFPVLPPAVTENIDTIAEPLRHALYLFPIVAAFFQWGLRAAAGVAVVALATVVGAGRLHALPGGLSSEGLGLLVGTVVIIAAAMRHRRADPPPVPALFDTNLRGLRRTALPLLVPIGALCGALAQAGALAGDPAAALLLGSGHRWDAAVVGLFSAAAFAPMVSRSAATSGSYSTQGYPDWVLSAGMLSGSPVIGAAAGMGTLTAELLAAPRVLAALNRYPALAELGSSMRQAMTVVIDLAVLVGSAAAATAIRPEIGAAVVVGLFVWNEATQRRLMPVAVGPVGVIVTALVAALASVGR
jgi:hypothetical protein